MTTLAVWMSQDSKGTQTLYIGADSLGTPIDASQDSNRFVKKVFNCANSPEIFAFCGDVSWGKELLRRLTQKIDKGDIPNGIGSTQRIDAIKSDSILLPSKSQSDLPLELLYAVRIDFEGRSRFKVYHLKHSGKFDDSWSCELVRDLDQQVDKTTFVTRIGAGRKGYFDEKLTLLSDKSSPGQVSRVYFWTLCKLIEKEPDPDSKTGGVPQLVKLDNTGPGKSVGVKYFDKFFHFGRLVPVDDYRDKDWVDETFTSLNPETMEPWSNGSNYNLPRQSIK